MCRQLERGLCSNNVGTVLEVLLDMRRYRMGLIQTPDQLRFSYQAIVHAARQRLAAATPLVSYTDKWGCVFTGLQITLHHFIDPRVVAGTI